MCYPLNVSALDQRGGLKDSYATAIIGGGDGEDDATRQHCTRGLWQ